MIKYFLYLNFFITSLSLFSHQVDFNFEGDLSYEDQFVFVSLGSGCDTGLTLRDCGLRNAAFPFDWLVTGDHAKFIELLNDDFKFFTDENYIEPLIDPNLSDHPNPLKNTYYNILFYHEGSELYDWNNLEQYQAQLERLKIKYHKRVNRFRQIRTFQGKVFFIRNFTSTSEQINHHYELATELRDALRRFFPNVDFTLVVVTYNDVNAPAIGNLEGVLEFRMDRPPWRSEYEKMYKTLCDMYIQK